MKYTAKNPHFFLLFFFAACHNLNIKHGTFVLRSASYLYCTAQCFGINIKFVHGKFFFIRASKKLDRNSSSFCFHIFKRNYIHIWAYRVDKNIYFDKNMFWETTLIVLLNLFWQHPIQPGWLEAKPVELSAIPSLHHEYVSHLDIFWTYFESVSQSVIQFSQPVIQ